MRWLPPIAILLLLSGCAAPEEVPPAGDEAPPSEGPVDASPAPGSPAAGEPSAASPPDSASPPSEAGSAPPVPVAPVVASCDVAHAAGLAVSWPLLWTIGLVVPPAQDVVPPPGCSVGELTPVAGGRFRSVLVEFQWENDGPMTDVELAIRANDFLALVGGTSSPLRYVVTADQIPEGPVMFSMEHGGYGAYLDFKGTTWFSAFETETPPEGYTAIP